LSLFSSRCDVRRFVLLTVHQKPPDDATEAVSGLAREEREGEVSVTIILSGQALIESLEIDDDALAEISLILEMRRNFNLSIYKDKCMKRRVAIRMHSCRCLDAAAYCDLLRQSEQELDLLKKTLTIHVSQFFRNPSMFEKLQTVVLPHLFQKAATAGERLRFCSLGCAGGEEAYTLGIIVRAFFVQELLRTPVDIYASDIDADILQAAVRAEYNEERLKDLPDSIRERYFTANGPHLQLSPQIQKMVTFQLQNIMDVGLSEPCQLALCRNTLIYFNRPDQEKILHGIAYILPSGGVLVLGKSETLVGDARGLFTTLCPVERIYRRI
jgi:chemotaxis protein methyltransferase CheR